MNADPRRHGLYLALCVLLASGCTRLGCECGDEARAGGSYEGAAGAPASGGAGSGSDRTPTLTEMKDVDLRVMEGATLHVRYLIGQAVSVQPGQPVALDDKTSYEIDVESAETTIGYADLAQVMNEYTFAFDGAPVKSIRIAREEDLGQEDEIELKGLLKKGLRLPFEIEGRPEVTPDGRIRIRSTSIQALDLEVGGLMHALGLEAKDMLGNLEERGLTVIGDDMILDMSRAMPPPLVKGRVTAVRVGPNALTLLLGSRAGSRRTAASRRSNYLWFRKGTLRIGKMTQRDADLRIVDLDPNDPLDFYGDRLTQQLVAGYSKLSESGGLTMFVPDYGDIQP